MRKIVPITLSNCDILIYDQLGENFLYRCFPSTAVVQTLHFRDQIPFVYHPTLFFQFVSNYLYYRKFGPSARSYAYLASLIDQIDPKIIVTFSDNNSLMGLYARNNKDKLVISIQNALRDSVSSFPPRTCLPVYFSLGHAEKDLFRKNEITYDECIPIGSLKLGVFLSDNEISGRKWDIAFCSHFRPELIKSNSVPLQKLIDATQRRLFSYACKYAERRALSICVLSKTRSHYLQSVELSYFQQIASGLNFDFIVADKKFNEFSTYNAALSSDLVISLCSTIGYEAMAAGRKVLFGAGCSSHLIQDWGAAHYFDHLPSFVQLLSNDFGTFLQTVDQLRAIDQRLYESLIHQSAYYYVAMPKDNFPHNIVKSRIEEHLNISNNSDLR